MVGVRNTGAVSRMKSFQNWPGSSSALGAGASRMSRSSNPFSSSVPAKDSSMMNTTRCPRRRSTSPMPTQLLVGPYAPSGKNTMVAWAASLAWLICGIAFLGPDAIVLRQRGVAQLGSAFDWGSKGRWFKSSRPD